MFTASSIKNILTEKELFIKMRFFFTIYPQDVTFLCQDHLLKFDIQVPEAETDLSAFQWWGNLLYTNVDSQFLQEIVGK